MNVLVACEESQRVTIEFRKLGHKAYSCDLLDCSGNHPEWHIKKDVTLLLNGNCIFNTVDGLEHEISGKWDMIIAFPPCTYLTVTGNRWYNYEKYGDKAMATQWGSEEKHYDDYTSEDFINAGIAKECKQKPPKGHIYIDTDSVKVAPLPEQQTSEESITDTIIADDNSSYNIEVLRAKQDLNTKYSNSYRKHLHAIINPEWHHVSLATLANIDNDMSDEKRRHYMKVYRMTANVINSIYKCNKLTSIDKLRTNLIQTVRTMAKNEKIEWALVQYVKAKIDNCYLVNGLQSSFYSKTYGHNKSRSYTKTFFI